MVMIDPVKKLTLWLAVFAVGYLVSTAAYAESPGNVGDADYFKLILALLFIIGLILACAWFVRRMAGGAGLNQRHIKVLSVMPLGTREKLMLVKAADEYFLLGVTPNGISRLHQYDEPIAVDAVMTSPFADRLKGLLKGQLSDSATKQPNKKSDDTPA